MNLGSLQTTALGALCLSGDFGYRETDFALLMKLKDGSSAKIKLYSQAHQ